MGSHMQGSEQYPVRILIIGGYPLYRRGLINLLQDLNLELELETSDHEL